MARTNFTGPINDGSVQQNTGTEFTPGKVRNIGFVTNTQSFYFDYTSINFTVDDNRFFTASTSTGAQTLLETDVSGIEINGNKHAMTIAFTSAGNDATASTTATVVGTDVFNQSQTEVVSLADAGVAHSTGAFNTLTSITFSAAPLSGGCKCGLLISDTITFLCQSPFNGYPLSQTSTTVDKNLANNINIPAWSRITGLRWLNVVAFNPGSNLVAEFGANQHTAADTWTLDMDYFAGVTGDIKGLGHYNMPVDLDVATGSQTKNILNVSGSDTSPYENDKLLAITCLQTSSVASAGEAIIYVDYVQGINNTN